MRDVRVAPRPHPRRRAERRGLSDAEEDRGDVAVRRKQAHVAPLAKAVRVALRPLAPMPRRGVAERRAPVHRMRGRGEHHEGRGHPAVRLRAQCGDERRPDALGEVNLGAVCAVILI